MNYSFNLTMLDNLPLKETVQEACVSIPNILGILIFAFVVQTFLMFLIAKFPLKHKYDEYIRQGLVIICFVVLCLIGIMIYYAYTF